jgi:hypothetical protein
MRWAAIIRYSRAVSVEETSGADRNEIGILRGPSLANEDNG